MVSETLEGMPSFMGVSMKHLSLITLTFQNSALILIMHYSRIMPKTSANRYFTSTAVFLNEVLKLSISIWVAYLERRKIDGPKVPVAKSIKHLCGDVFRPDNWKLAIPACLYTLQNSLQYVAVSNLDAATFQVTYQLKILTTALFSVLMLHRNLTAKKWVSLIMLTVGIAIVQLPTAAKPIPDNASESSSMSSASKLHRRSATYEGIDEDTMEPEMNRAIGLIAVAVACTISGLAGVYFEKVLKGSNTTLWVRNVQLSFYSLFPAFFIGVVAKDGKEILERGFFDGYNNIVWAAIGCQALGGIVVALCVNYADNIAKNFATSISILLSFIASIYCFDFEVTVGFMIGAGIVLFATWLYSTPDGLIPKWKQEYIPLEQTDSKADHDGKDHEGEETVGKSSIDGLKRSD